MMDGSSGHPVHAAGSKGRSGVRIGVSSYAAVRQPLADAAAELLGLGEEIEIMCEPPHAWPAPIRWEGDRLISLHMPILGINIASTNPGVRRESVRQIEETINEAARLGAVGVVVHPGTPPYEEIMPRDRGLPYAIESLRALCESAAAAGIEVYLENMPDVAVGANLPRIGHKIIYGVTYEELRHIYDSVRHPSLRLCLDLGHAFLAGRSTLDAMLRDPDVVHIHVNDNLGWRDDHLAWGDGEISKVVNLADDLSPSVRTVIFETKSIDAARTSLARVSHDLGGRR
ncbi:MAG: sugar phosphate isomerase/epimerase family protein [Armatimonadota bacterium]|nr:sugar phosphate isomerase/epimerase family protein [Armatimonadota bacterium]